MSETSETKIYENSIFFCYSIDKSIYNKNFFLIECLDYFYEPDFEIIDYNDLTILRVFVSEGCFNILGNNALRFKIIYKVQSNNSILYESQDFTVEINKIKFNFNAAKYAKKNSQIIKNPSCLNQYNSFSNLKNIENILFSNTLYYLKNNLDLLLYIHLLKNKREKEQEELINIFDNFPKFNIEFDEDIYNQNFDFKFSIPKGICIKLKILVSVIKDSSDTLDESYEGCIELINNYNSCHKECPIPIKNNIFNLLDKN